GRGLFEFNRFPFGLHNAPATWQRLINKVIGPALEPHVFVYLDDIVIATADFDSNLRILREVLRRLRDAGLTVSRGKYQLARTELKYLGFVLSRSGLQTDPDKVNAILNLQA